MKRTAARKQFRKGSLTAELGAHLFLSALAAFAIFLVLRTGGDALLTRYFEETNFQEQSIARKINSLQKYVSENELTAHDSGMLTMWVKKNPLILMEIYRANILLYTSSSPEQFAEEENELESPYYDWVSYHSVMFADGEGQVVIYADDTQKWFSALTITSLTFAFLLFVASFLFKSKKLVNYICCLSEQIQAMEGGDLDQPILVEGNNELSQLAQGLDTMRQSFKEQQGREIQLLRANQTMITQMSHDLRTPLTALQIYTDILRYRKFENSEQSDAYLHKIDAKIAQIKQLSENIFEYSLVSGSQQVNLNPPQSIRDVFHDALSEMVAYLGQQSFHFSLDLDWPDEKIRVYPQYVKRVIDNLTSNFSKYADPTYPIGISVSSAQNVAALSFINHIRHDHDSCESNQIGLSNVRVMMEKMGGALDVVSVQDQFQVTLRFPVSNSIAEHTEDMCENDNKIGL